MDLNNGLLISFKSEVQRVMGSIASVRHKESPIELKVSEISTLLKELLNYLETK